MINKNSSPHIKTSLWLILLLLTNTVMAEQVPPAPKFIKGFTTQGDVRKMLGEPDIIKTKDNKETIWIFNNMLLEYEINGKEASLSGKLILRFDKQGVLVDYEMQAKDVTTEIKIQKKSAIPVAAEREESGN